MLGYSWEKLDYNLETLGYSLAKLDYNLVTSGYIQGSLDYIVEKTGYILVMQVMMVPSLDLLVHIVDLKENVQAKVHELEKVHMLTLQVSLVIRAEDSMLVSIQGTIHLHRCLKVKILVHQESCHFPFRATTEPLHKLV